MDNRDLKIILGALNWDWLDLPGERSAADAVTRRAELLDAVVAKARYVIDATTRDGDVEERLGGLWDALDALKRHDEERAEVWKNEDEHAKERERVASSVELARARWPGARYRVTDVNRTTGERRERFVICHEPGIEVKALGPDWEAYVTPASKEAEL